MFTTHNTGSLDTLRTAGRVKPHRATVSNHCKATRSDRALDVSCEPNSNDKRRKQKPHFIFCQNCIVLIFLNERFFTVSKVNFKKRKANIHLAIIDIV